MDPRTEAQIIAIEEKMREQKPVSQNILSNVPAKFKDLTRYTGDHEKKADRLTGLPIFDGSVRYHIIGEFSDAIKKGEGWAIFSADLDDLKRANLISRSLGDDLIVAGTNDITQAFDPALLSPTAKIYAVRPTHAADEVIIFGAGLNQNDFEMIRNRQREIVQMKIDLKEDKKGDEQNKFTSTVSSCLLTSEDVDLQRAIEVNKRALLNGEVRHTYAFFKGLINLTDKRIVKIKINKEMKRLREVIRSGKAEGIDFKMMIDSLTLALGNRRISEAALKEYSMFISVMAAEEQVKRIQEVLAGEGQGDLLIKHGFYEERQELEPHENITEIFKRRFPSKESVDKATYTPLPDEMIA
ncbi:MAG: hypothetical protein HYW86_05430 [Candidatus Roizmanbacteria bacterium]|nr:MAG: hypothetical protein HYW86_05430 [Candidatus Roizmanbacteria bacterium]